jgi:RyR domain
MKPDALDSIAQVCHEANRAYCRTIGDDSQLPWNDAPEWQRTSAVNGVKFSLANPDAPASASHDSWMAEKQAAGWKYGPVKDVERKEHPCFLPFAELPADQRRKDVLFQAIVRALT